MNGKLSADEVNVRLTKALDTYVKGWGPISWRKQLDLIVVRRDAQLCSIFSALANIEDDAFYMNVKLRHAGALRRQPIEQFYSIWSAEESEHARVLTYLSDQYGDIVFAAGHTLRARDRRSALAIVGLRTGRFYERGMVAAYMALGMTQEYIAIVVYNSLINMIDEPEVRQVMRDIIRQEGRHMRFYKTGATALLQGDLLAQSFVRWVMSTYWRPPGIDLYGYDKWDELFEPFLDDAATVTSLLKLDQYHASVPGLAGIDVMQRFLGDRAQRIGRSVDGSAAEPTAAGSTTSMRRFGGLSSVPA